MATANGTAREVTLSGRELALMRRKAMALHGKAASGKSVASSRPTAQRGTRPAAQVVPRVAAISAEPFAELTPAVYRPEGETVSLKPTKNAARQRRAALSQVGKAALPMKSATLQASVSKAVGLQGSTRVAKAVSQQGATSSDHSYVAIAPATSNGRQVAMQRRAMRATKGRSGESSSKVASKGRSSESLSKAASAAPSSAQTQPALSLTASGQKVSGVSVDDSKSKVTGHEAGANRLITGTDYSQFVASSGSGVAKSAGSTPRKGSVMSSAPAGAQRSTRVTGDEFGASRQLTGTHYMNVEEVNSGSQSAASSGAAPAKVAKISTLGGNTVTGTDLARSSKVTGGEKGGCRPVTGTEYIGSQQLQAVCATTESVKPVAKVGQDQTWRGQGITGSHVGRSGRVTGDEPGGCAPISGTPYIGRGQYKSFCDDQQSQAQETRLRSEAVISAATVTGDRPGAGGSVMTGDDRGACEVVTGSPYVGPDNMPAQCQTSNRFVARARPSDSAPTGTAPSDFSIKPPSRQAKERDLNSVTGTSFGTHRITGPVNKAGGLITGTPEFRHVEPNGALAKTQTVAQVASPSAAERLTGEGSQAGVRISGDAWQSSGRVTGTEGTSSLARNPSQRGNPRGAGANAQQFLGVERAAPPESRITGSSGSTSKGAAVTLSGGARG